MSGEFVASYVILWALVLVLSIALLACLRQLSVLYDALNPVLHFRPLDSIKIGETLSWPTSYNEGSQPPDLSLDGSFRCILMITPNCAKCTDLLDEVRELLASPGPGWAVGPIVVLGPVRSKDRSPLEHLQESFAGMEFIIDSQGEGKKHWGVRVTPLAVLIDGTGKVIAKLSQPTKSDLEPVLTQLPPQASEFPIFADDSISKTEVHSGTILAKVEAQEDLERKRSAGKESAVSAVERGSNGKANPS